MVLRISARRQPVKIVWISPAGAGQETAKELVAQGHALVSWPSEVGGSVILRDQLTVFSKAADLVVVDGPFPLERTKRSWRPAAASLFFDELRRKHRVTALGPTPTIDLLIGDARYRAKWCNRLGLRHDKPSDVETTERGGWFRPGDPPDDPLLRPWSLLFGSVGFRGWFSLVLAGDAVVGCTATWPSGAMPEVLSLAA